MLQDYDLEWYHSLPEDQKEDWLYNRKLCDESLYFFIVQMGMFAQRAGGDANEYIHKPIAEFWQDDTIKRKAIFCPRDWFKSVCWTKWANLWAYLQRPDIRILLASQKIGLANSFLRFIKSQAVTNKRLRFLYPILHRITAQWRHEHPFGASECEFPGHAGQSDPTFRTIGITGGSQGGHFERIGIDDIISEKAIESPGVMEDACRWIDNVEELLDNPIKTDPNGGIITIVGTFWKPGDVGCYIKQTYPEYHWRIVPCQKDNDLVDTDTVKYIQHPEAGQGETNFPESKFTTKYYVDMSLNPEKQLIYWSQHMNLPERSTGLTTFNADWLKYFHYEEDEGIRYLVCEDDKERFKVDSIRWFAMLDPGGFSKKLLTKRGSRTAILIGGQPDNSKKKFIKYAKAFRFKETDLFMDEVFKAETTMKPALWEQDAFAQQPYILSDIQSESKKRGIPLRIMAMPADERKDAKNLNIDALKNPMFCGEFYIMKDMTDLVGEIRSFPGGLTRDLLDMMGKLMQLHLTRGARGDSASVAALNRLNDSYRPTSKAGY